VRIISNLLSNAAKFTEKGTIRISAGHDAAFTHVAVADTGIGIAGEHVDRIFEEFERVEAQGQGKREGSGLGLAICRRFAAIMGGKITVQSTLGEGSVFTFSFPNTHPKTDADKIFAETGRSGDGVADPAVMRGEAKVTVLVVDDASANPSGG